MQINTPIAIPVLIPFSVQRFWDLTIHAQTIQSYIECAINGGSTQVRVVFPSAYRFWIPFCPCFDPHKGHIGVTPNHTVAKYGPKVSPC